MAKPTLLGIEHNGPVKVKDWTGSVYPLGTVYGTFEPTEFDRLVDFINRNGGPSFWTIHPITTRYLTTPGGNPAKDQQVQETDQDEMFRSYGKPVALREQGSDVVKLDERWWNYSQTTTRYLCQFLSDASTKVNKRIIEQRIESGEYELTDLGN